MCNMGEEMAKKVSPAIPGPMDTVLSVLEKILVVETEILATAKQQLAVSQAMLIILGNIDNALVGEQVTDFTLEQTR